MPDPMRDLTQTIATLQAASAAPSWADAITRAAEVRRHRAGELKHADTETKP